MIDAVLHLGHCFRTKGATGTSGHRGTEQRFVATVGEEMASLLRLRGYDVQTALADDPLPRCVVFMALHQDGSTSPAARGASVGYPPGVQNQQLAAIWKAFYTRAGWPSGFRPDNYTSGLRRYYAFRRVHADAKILVEHGFATNQLDADWMWDHIPEIVAANCDTLAHFIGPRTTQPDEETDMQIINDTELRRMWAGWDKDGTQHVREFGSYRGADVGTAMPGIGYVIDQQTASGNIVRVT